MVLFWVSGDEDGRAAVHLTVRRGGGGAVAQRGIKEEAIGRTGHAAETEGNNICDSHSPVNTKRFCV